MSLTRKPIGAFGMALAAGVLLAWPLPAALADDSGKAKVVMTGHPEKQHAAVVVPHVNRPMPAPKAEKAPTPPSDAVAWVPGDYYWGGDDWSWDKGYWLNRPSADVTWIPGHWAQRWWGWTWVSGYWF